MAPFPGMSRGAICRRVCLPPERSGAGSGERNTTSCRQTPRGGWAAADSGAALGSRPQRAGRGHPSPQGSRPRSGERIPTWGRVAGKGGVPDSPNPFSSGTTPPWARHGPTPGHRVPRLSLPPAPPGRTLIHLRYQARRERWDVWPQFPSPAPPSHPQSRAGRESEPVGRPGSPVTLIKFPRRWREMVSLKGVCSPQSGKGLGGRNGSGDPVGWPGRLGISCTHHV